MKLKGQRKVTVYCVKYHKPCIIRHWPLVSENVPGVLRCQNWGWIHCWWLTNLVYISVGLFSALLKRTFHDHCMVFIQTKKQAHRMHILLGLLGIKVGELHGNLSQAQVNNNHSNIHFKTSNNRQGFITIVTYYSISTTLSLKLLTQVPKYFNYINMIQTASDKEL